MASPNRQIRILYVEDEEDAWALMAFIIPQYKLVIAHDFYEGLRQARQRYFDLYILDNWLPDGSGVDLCRSIREFDPHTPILFYSACAYGDDIEEARNAGAQAYLIKPVSFEELEKAVNELISGARAAAFEARRAEIAAIQEDLAFRRVEIRRRMEAANRRWIRAENNLLRLKAMDAFLAAGGTRGEFARLWVSLRSQDLR